MLRNTEAAESDLYVFVEWYTFLKRVERLDMCPRVLGFIYKGFKFFGFKIGLQLLWYAICHKVNIFRGL